MSVLFLASRSVSLFCPGAHDLTSLWRLSWSPVRRGGAGALAPGDGDGDTAADGGDGTGLPSVPSGFPPSVSAAMSRPSSQLSASSSAAGVSDTGTGEPSADGQGKALPSSTLEPTVQSVNPNFFLMVNHPVSGAAAAALAARARALEDGLGSRRRSPKSSRQQAEG